MGSSPSVLAEPAEHERTVSGNFYIIPSSPAVVPDLSHSYDTQPNVHRQSTHSFEFEEQDTSKDDLISKILSAEEFQSQLDDCDSRIKKLCEADERELHLNTIESCVSLRGHLQDELLRIVAMLKEGYHSLQFLEDFELSNPRIVEILRSLESNAASDITIETFKEGDNDTVRCNELPPIRASIRLPNAHENTKKEDKSELKHLNPLKKKQSVREQKAREILDDDIDVDTNSKHRFYDEWNGGKENKSLINDNSKLDEVCIDPGIEIEDVLTNLQEEADIVKQYTREIVHLGPCEINDVLNSHLLCMQGLRDQQAREKQMFNSTLFNKSERLLTSRDQTRPSTSSKLNQSDHLHRPSYHMPHLGYQENSSESSEESEDNQNNITTSNEYIKPVLWADNDIITDGSRQGQSIKVEDYSSSDSSNDDDDITERILNAHTEQFTDLLKEHLNNKAILRRRKNEDKEKFNERLRQRKEQKLNNLKRQLVEYLAHCHLNNDLSINEIKRVIAKYRKEQEKINDSASNLLLEHQQQSKHLSDFKKREKQKLDEKLERKIAGNLNV